MRHGLKSGFTLVEILIVVVILGILSAVVIPRFAQATEEAAVSATVGQLRKLQDALEVYQIRNGYVKPTVVAGSGTWGEIVTGGDYLRRPPINRWVGPETGAVIIFGQGPDTGFHTSYGWIYNEDTAEVWAAAFDEDGNPFPKQ